MGHFIKKKNHVLFGDMNTSFKNNKYLKIFLPDPQSSKKVKPIELKISMHCPGYIKIIQTSNFLLISQSIFFVFLFN